MHVPHSFSFAAHARQSLAIAWTSFRSIARSWAGLGFFVVVPLLTIPVLLMTAGMLSQLILGHQDFELGLYVTALFGLQFPEYLLFAVLALAIHVVVGQKYAGHLAAIVVYAVIVLAPAFGIEHNLLIYGAGPWVTFTQMRGLGPFVEPWLWFKLYWAAWALLLAVGARMMTTSTG